ncbi:hypothetical protein F4604DRAFT_1676352 [Suillus subluteus]|nr:hypothetical protein F4604DRAFT_1676352 [Suillus subluteus]
MEATEMVKVLLGAYISQRKRARHNGMLQEWRPAKLSPEKGMVVHEPEDLEQWRIENYWNKEKELADERPKSLVLYGPAITGALTWARSLEGEQIYQRGTRDPLGYDKMTRDADCIIFDDLAKASELIDLHFRWICAQGLFDAENDAYGEGIYVSPRQRPSICFMKADPREGGDEDRDLLEYLFDFVHVTTPLCAYDSNLSALQEREDEEDEEDEGVMGRLRLFRDEEPGSPLSGGFHHPPEVAPCVG